MKTQISLCLLVLVHFSSGLLAQNASTYRVKNIITVNINSSINPATLSYVKSAMNKAQNLPDSCVLIKLNTPGGLVSTTKKILRVMGESSVPTIVWITPESASATSAGAIIAAGAHFLVMNRGTNIGAATPINMSAENLGEDLRSKAINDLVALVSSLSQARGRNPILFAKMVEQAASFTSEEALKENIIDSIANDEASLLSSLQGSSFQLHGKPYQVNFSTPTQHSVEMDLGQKILNFFADPNMAYILFLLGALLLYLEMQAPGSFLPGSLGILFMLLSGISFQVLPLNVGALFLLVLAFILFVLEAYITSYGLLSLSGVCSLVFGSLFLFRTEDSYMDISYKLILAACLGIISFLVFLAAFLIKDIRRRKETPEDLYSLTQKNGIVTRVFGRDESLSLFKYQIRVEGEIWTAYSEKELKLRAPVTVLGPYKHGLSLLIE